MGIFKINDMNKVNSLRIKLKEMGRENKIQTKVQNGQTFWRKLKKNSFLLL